MSERHQLTLEVNNRVVPDELLHIELTQAEFDSLMATGEADTDGDYDLDLEIWYERYISEECESKFAIDADGVGSITVWPIGEDKDERSTTLSGEIVAAWIKGNEQDKPEPVKAEPTMSNARAVELMLQGRPRVMQVMLTIKDEAQREEAVLMVLKEAMDDLIKMIDLTK